MGVVAIIGGKEEMWYDVQEVIKGMPQRVPDTYHIENHQVVVDSWLIVYPPNPLLKRSDGQWYEVDDFYYQSYETPVETERLHE